VEWFEGWNKGRKRVEREEWMERLDRAKGKVERVVVTEADRISRDTFPFGGVAPHMQVQGIERRIINERPAETPAEKAFQKMRAVFAEFETELRPWRINRGSAQARQQNRFMSRPPLGEVEALFQGYASGASMAALARSVGRSRRSVGLSCETGSM